AGALTLEDGARVVALRSQAVRPCAGRGAMVQIGLGADEVAERIKGYGPALSVAVVNTARQVVVSGEVAAVEAVMAELTAEGVFVRKVKVDYASHSAQMDAVLPALGEALAAVAPRAGTIAMYSTVEGRVVAGEELTGRYWCRNLREPVRLDLALAQLRAAGHGVFVEVSAHPVLGMALGETSSESEGVVVGSLERDRGELAALLRTVGALHVAGVEIDWRRVFAGTGAARVDLPTYAFQRERYWRAAASGGGDAAALGVTRAEHPWLGLTTALASGEGQLFAGRLALADHPWLADHAVFGTVLVPGTGLLELALAAGRAVGAAGVGSLTLLEPLVLGTEGARRLQIAVGPAEGGRRSIALYSQAEATADVDAWTQHAAGELTDELAGADEREALRTWPVPGAEPVALDGFYDRLRARGVAYGPAFQGLVELWRHGETLYGRVVLPEAASAAATSHAI